MKWLRRGDESRGVVNGNEQNDSIIECVLVRPICTRYEISISMVSAFVAVFHRIKWYLFMILFSINYKQTRYTKIRLSNFAQNGEIERFTRCLL